MSSSHFGSPPSSLTTPSTSYRYNTVKANFRYSCSRLRFLWAWFPSISSKSVVLLCGGLSPQVATSKGYRQTPKASTLQRFPSFQLSLGSDNVQYEPHEPQVTNRGIRSSLEGEETLAVAFLEQKIDDLNFQLVPIDSLVLLVKQSRVSITHRIRKY